MWPTPAAQDAKNSALPPSQMNRDSVPGALMRLAGPPDPESPSTGGKSRDWHAITSHERTHTPRQTNAIKGGVPFANQVAEEERVKGSLNPRWVLQLMGFPPDWLDGVNPDGDGPV